jgi:hypothetical protein
VHLGPAVTIGWLRFVVSLPTGLDATAAAGSTNGGCTNAAARDFLDRRVMDDESFCYQAPSEPHLTPFKYGD